MTIRAIFFDMGGTLERVFYTREGRMKVMPEFNQYVGSSGIGINLSDKELFEVINEGYAKYHRWCVESLVELPPFKVWRDFILAGHSIDEGKLEASAEGLMYFLEDNFFQREFRPEVPEILESIQNHNFKVGLISNICCHNLVPNNLRKYKISKYFDPIVLSCEYGRRKPDPAIFYHTAELAEISTNECLYVGDRIARDIVGARKAGFAGAVQIINDFDHGEEDTGAEPDAVIQNMSELLSFLGIEKRNSK